VCTAADLARFFAQLSPGAERSVLLAASRREMVRQHWRVEDSSIERYYGLGIISGAHGPWKWFGHTGAWQGFISRTVVVPAQNLTVSVVTNAINGPAHEWVEGILHILRRFAEGGAPAPQTAGWTGRWWTIWRATDLVPIGSRVLCAEPAMLMPFQDAAEIEVTGADEGRIVKAMGFRSFGEPARLVRDGKGELAGVRLAGSRLVGEAELQQEMRERYGASPPSAPDERQVPTA
jgi:D-alanyl-D-alanine carboxypeptidase